MRRYVTVHTRRYSPEYIFDRIRQAIQAENLTRTIPAVKFEKGARGEFYYFFALEGQQLDFLDIVQTIFTQWGVPGTIIRELLEPEAIKSMASGELETHSFNALDYRSLWFNNASDPFDLSDLASNTENKGDAALGERYDRLLHYLSANGEGTWQTFAKICDVLQLAGDVRTSRSIFRRLILLGYIESSENGQKWSICPMALVKCAEGPDVCFLTGQQTPKLIEHIKEHWKVETLPQPNYQGPSCVKLRGVFLDDASFNGFRVRHTGVVSVRLAQLLPDLEGWKNILPIIDRLSTTTYNIEFWNGRQFTQGNGFYERHGKYFGESGMYRLTKKEENNPYRIVLYFDEPNQRWLRGDWYGLRFLAYDDIGRDFEVRYDSNTNEILIPVEKRWPLLYERALVLASGCLPSQSENPKWLKYSGISSELVQLLTEKLSISTTKI